VRPVSAGEVRGLSGIPRETLGRFVFGPANNRVVEEIRAADETPGGWTAQWTRSTRLPKTSN
jgi:hypothetical protein